MLHLPFNLHAHGRPPSIGRKTVAEFVAAPALFTFFAGRTSALASIATVGSIFLKEVIECQPRTLGSFRICAIRARFCGIASNDRWASCEKV